MKIHFQPEILEEISEAKLLYTHLLKLEGETLELDDADLYYDFPLYRDDDEQLISTHFMLVSKVYGIIIFYFSSAAGKNITDHISTDDETLEHVYGHVYSRLMKQKSLRKGRKELLISVESIIFAPFIENIENLDTESKVIKSLPQLSEFITECHSPIAENVFKSAASTLEGGKGLLKAQERTTVGFPLNSKVQKVAELETKLARFDSDQLMSSINEIIGIERIRGLAGSGKTVILAMKVALTHIRHPNAKILYTFSTKALYQHVKRLITRFYRQFNDTDPDFLYKIKVMHSWGGSRSEGVYHQACINNEANFYNYSTAQNLNRSNPFSGACHKLLTDSSIEPEYDYIFIDEAQDFDENFLQLCLKLTTDEKLVFGSDVFQNIFQTQAPSIEQLLGENHQLKSDTFIQTCYRTPCVTLLTAHAVGLGVYGKPVQVIKSAEDWHSLGYVTKSKDVGNFVQNERVIVERTELNTPSLYENDINELIKTKKCDVYDDEIKWVADKVIFDLENEGLNPTDILIICADDKNYKRYFNSISTLLDEKNIDLHNVNADKYSITDFSVKNKVTYSTIHKAKGNESYSVYVIGVDALFYSPNVRNRNLLFTAMTRTKGWLAISGLGDKTLNLFAEIEQAKSNFPNLDFLYPDEKLLRSIELDLKQKENPEDQLKMKKLLEQYGEAGLKQMMKDLASTAELKK